MTTTIAFRVDSSIEIGTGHMMRCLTLADELKSHGFLCHFICRNHSGSLFSKIQQHGHLFTQLPQISQTPPLPKTPKHANWLGTNWETDAQQTSLALSHINAQFLIVDHYAIDARWETFIKQNNAIENMVIDDLADRPHQCAILLDQNLGREPHHYSPLISADTQLLLGVDYALLRREFSILRNESLHHKNTPHSLKNILITLGGIDKDNITQKILSTLKETSLPHNIKITVVMGKYAPNIQSVLAFSQTMPWPTDVKIDINNMAEIMAYSDLAIGAAGSTAWERCVLGLPTIQIVLADNQLYNSQKIEEYGAAITLSNNNIKNELPKLISDIQKHPEILHKISHHAAQLCKGQGCKKVAAFINDHIKNLKKLSEK